MNISHLFAHSQQILSSQNDYVSIWIIDDTLIDTTTLGQSQPGSNGNKVVLHIPQSSRFSLVTSPGLSLRRMLIPSLEML